VGDLFELNVKLRCRKVKMGRQFTTSVVLSHTNGAEELHFCTVPISKVVVTLIDGYQ
jgi:hypothetical protein